MRAWKKRAGAAVLCLLLAHMLTSCAGQDPQVKAQVTLEPLTEEAYDSVGTKGLDSPSMDDFQKLTVSLSCTGLSKDRDIAFPSLVSMRNALGELVWTSKSLSDDNASSGTAVYTVEMILYTHGAGQEEVRALLSDEDLDISVTCRYAQSEEFHYSKGLDELLSAADNR